jgi:hypothetical protein
MKLNDNGDLRRSVKSLKFIRFNLYGYVEKLFCNTNHFYFYNLSQVLLILYRKIQVRVSKSFLPCFW